MTTLTDEPAADPVEIVPTVPVAVNPPATDPVVTPPADPAPVADWRQRMADGDDKLLGYLARIPSEKEAVSRLKKYDDDFKAGRFLKPLGEDATDEDKAAWRTAMGVPEKADDYYKALPDGLVVGDEDKPFVDAFVNSMHSTGAPPAVVNAALETYYKIVEDQQAEELQAAEDARVAGEEVLRSEWQGGEFKRNINIVQNFLNTLPETVSSAFREGRGSDGLPLGSNPDVLRWLANMALDANPVSTVVPGSGSDQAQSVAEEIAKIEQTMRADRRAYNNNEAMQERYRTLIDAREKLKSQ